MYLSFTMTDGYALILKVFFKKAVLWKPFLSSLSTSADDSFWTGVQMGEQDAQNLCSGCEHSERRTLNIDLLYEPEFPTVLQ